MKNCASSWLFARTIPGRTVNKTKFWKALNLYWRDITNQFKILEKTKCIFTQKKM